MKTTRTRPPSRIRYEESHPVISFRIKKEWYDELKNLLRTQDITIADFFKIALKKQKINRDKIWKEGYEEGSTFYVPCCVCEHLISFNVDDQETLEKVQEAFSKWGHTECLKKEKT